MLALSLVLALSCGQTPQHRLFKQPNLPRVASFSLQDTFAFAATPSLPTCTGDAHCVFQCRVKSDFSGGACYDNTGAEMSGFTDGVGAAFYPSYIPGVYAWTGIDDTSSSTAIPRISHASIRSMFGGDYTFVYQGYANTTVNANGGWYSMITDATNGLQARRGSGNLQCLDVKTGNVDSATLPLDGYGVWSCRRASGTLTARAASTDGSGVASTSGAVTGSNAFYLWGGTGGCCTPGGGAAGQLVSITGYDEAKSAAWLLSTEKSAFGASAVQSGAAGSAGTVGSVVIGNENANDAGYVFMFANGAYIGSPWLGIHAQNALQNYAGADPLSICAGTDVGTPTCTANQARGPFSLWKNTSEMDLIVDNDAAAFEGKRSGAISGLGLVGFDGGSGSWVNGSVWLQPGTSGTTTTKARIVLTLTGGAVDAGSTTCDVTIGSGNRRYPENTGCWIWQDNATAVTMDVLVGNAASDTGSVLATGWSLTPTLFMEAPTISNANRGATYPVLDGGGVPSGSAKGKIEVVFSLKYSTSQYGAAGLAQKVFGTYPLDATNSTSTHTVLQWVTYSSNQASFEGLMYGTSGTDENRFAVAPTEFTAGQFYVTSYEWRPSGSGCRGTMRLDTCSDPATCLASTIIATNTGAVGECPLATEDIDIGTRSAGSSPSTVDVYSLRIYR